MRGNGLYSFKKNLTLKKINLVFLFLLFVCVCVCECGFFLLLLLLSVVEIIVLLHFMKTRDKVQVEKYDF